MNYRVRWEERATESVRSWRLPRPLLVEVYNRVFIDLPANPDALLGERIVPLQAFAYKFSLVEPGERPRRHDFLFGVERDDAGGILRIVGARHETDDTNGELEDL